MHICKAFLHSARLTLECSQGVGHSFPPLCAADSVAASAHRLHVSHAALSTGIKF